jgi:hypothetical protein
MQALALLRCVSFAMHTKRRSGRRLAASHGDNECFSEDATMHRTIAESMHKYSDDVIGIFSPDRLLSPRFHRENGRNLTGGGMQCDNDERFKFITPDTPLNEKAICNYQHVVNYNAKVGFECHYKFKGPETKKT